MDADLEALLKAWQAGLDEADAANRELKSIYRSLLIMSQLAVNFRLTPSIEQS
jgi:hypothetical protein